MPVSDLCFACTDPDTPKLWGHSALAKDILLWGKPTGASGSGVADSGACMHVEQLFSNECLLVQHARVFLLFTYKHTNSIKQFCWMRGGTEIRSCLYGELKTPVGVNASQMYKQSTT